MFRALSASPTSFLDSVIVELASVTSRECAQLTCLAGLVEKAEQRKQKRESDQAAACSYFQNFMSFEKREACTVFAAVHFAYDVSSDEECSLLEATSILHRWGSSGASCVRSRRTQRAAVFHLLAGTEHHWVICPGHAQFLSMALSKATREGSGSHERDNVHFATDLQTGTQATMPSCAGRRGMIAHLVPIA